MCSINKEKNGSALAITLIVSTILITLALGYSKMVENTTKSTFVIDEHERAQYLADGLCKIVVLKFHKFSTDFYAAWQATSTEALLLFGENAPEFQPTCFLNLDDQPQSNLSKNNSGNIEDMIQVKVASITLQTNLDNKWKEDVLTVVTSAAYMSSRGQQMYATSTMSLVVNRDADFDLKD